MPLLFDTVDALLFTLLSSMQWAHVAAAGNSPEAAAIEACRLAVQQVLDKCERAGRPLGAAADTGVQLLISVPQHAQVNTGELRKLFNNIDGIEVMTA
jgi:hypothetical protein